MDLRNWTIDFDTILNMLEHCFVSPFLYDFLSLEILCDKHMRIMTMMYQICEYICWIAWHIEFNSRIPLFGDMHPRTGRRDKRRQMKHRNEPNDR